MSDATMTPETETEVEAEPFAITRIPFAESGLGETNDDGKLTAAPEIITKHYKMREGDEWPELGGFSTQFHLKPKRDDFAEEATYLDFQAADFRLRAEKLVAKASSFEARAAECRKYGDPATRAKIARRQRLQAQLEELEAQLEEEGFDTDELDADEV